MKERIQCVNNNLALRVYVNRSNCCFMLKAFKVYKANILLEQLHTSHSIDYMSKRLGVGKNVAANTTMRHAWRAVWVKWPKCGIILNVKKMWNQKNLFVFTAHSRALCSIKWLPSKVTVNVWCEHEVCDGDNTQNYNLYTYFPCFLIFSFCKYRRFPIHVPCFNLLYVKQCKRWWHLMDINRP